MLSLGKQVHRDYFSMLAIGTLIVPYVLSALLAIVRANSIAQVVPFYASSIVLSAVAGYFVFDEVPSIRTLVGSVFIVLGLCIPAMAGRTCSK